MTRRITAILALSLALLASPCLAAEKEPSGKPTASGTVTMDFGQGGFLISASGGKGTLTFKGRKHPFKVGGLGVGGIGVSRINAAGEVYNLTRIEDFAGAYFQARAGYAALDEGKGVHWLENSNGVVLKLRVSSKGLALNLGADGVVIEMGQIAKKKGK